MQTGRLAKDCRSVGQLVAPGFLVALLLTSCSSNLLQPSGASADEVEALERQIVELQKRATVGEVEVRRLEREVARLEAELAATRSPSESTPPVEHVATGTAVNPQVTDFRQPDVEESDLEPPPIVEETLTETAAPPSGPPAASEAVAAPGASANTEVAARTEATGVITEEAQSLYDAGYTLFHRKSYDAAEDRFQRYVELYPTTGLADNAMFWVGESRYARGDFDAALEAFSATVESFPQGNKVADALFKAGRCLENLAELDQARSTYREVERSYPGTAASAQARERLAAMN